MSNCHAIDSGKCGVKGGPSSTSSSRCLNCRTLWTRISVAFSCSCTPSSLVRVVRNRIEDRNFGKENMQSSHPHPGQCTARGWIWSRSHWRSWAPARGGSSSKDNEGIYSNNCAYFWPRISRQVLYFAVPAGGIVSRPLWHRFLLCQQTYQIRCGLVTGYSARGAPLCFLVRSSR